MGNSIAYDTYWGPRRTMVVGFSVCTSLIHGRNIGYASGEHGNTLQPEAHENQARVPKHTSPSPRHPQERPFSSFVTSLAITIILPFPYAAAYSAAPPFPSAHAFTIFSNLIAHIQAVQALVTPPELLEIHRDSPIATFVSSTSSAAR
jgi:hypothetical protein